MKSTFSFVDNLHERVVESTISLKELRSIIRGIIFAEGDAHQHEGDKKPHLQRFLAGNSSVEKKMARSGAKFSDKQRSCVRIAKQFCMLL